MPTLTLTAEQIATLLTLVRASYDPDDASSAADLHGTPVMADLERILQDATENAAILTGAAR